MLPIKYLTIHAAATPEGRYIDPEVMEGWARARFGQKSYHWIVGLKGETHKGLADNQRGAHTGGKNTHNIGIAYVGGMDAQMKRAKDTRTPDQKAALLTLVRTYIARYPGIVIRGHRDWPGVRKDCPSFDVRAWLKAEGHTPDASGRYYP